MINILHDGNYLFYKSLYVYPRADKGRMLDSKNDRESFMQKNMIDFAYVTRKFKNLNKVIVTVDDHSWRKHVEIEENKGYKACRVKDETAVNWDSFNDILDQFSKILANKGIIISKSDGAEGDDGLFLWSERLLKDGQSSVIITGDGDLSQCVKIKGSNYIFVYDPRSSSKKLVVPIGFAEWSANDNSYDLMDASSYMLDSKSDIDNLIRESKINEINPDMVVFYKILTGDSGDDVPSVWGWQAKQSNGKTINKKVTPTKTARIFEILEKRYGEVDIFNLQKYSKDITENINLLLRQNATEPVIKERLIRNTKLVWLNEAVMPSYVIENFNQTYNKYKHLSTPEIKKYDMPTLLEGTEFYSGPDSFESDFFAKTKKNGKSLF